MTKNQGDILVRFTSIALLMSVTEKEKNQKLILKKYKSTETYGDIISWA
jgi:hypothetical protein